MSSKALQTLISEETIALNKNFENKIDAIEGLLQLIDDQGKVKDRDAALEALKQREKEATTGVGKGIGIPHSKTDAVTEPVAAFIRAENGVDFGAADGEPAKLLFMLLFPEGTEDEYLDVLSSISRSLIHDDVREKLLNAEEPSRVMEIIEEEVSR
ncbi:PTS sugar transporter subunit IIA [Candidatus Nanohalovita haloferacivicina]|uniref:PTS sugar transporter subunit IIA n=1 Tax=Candidatus Nanohalovita haloferacivicina TaxID=2978046 RepID=UPI00325FA43D|nr:Fructose PTS system EIIA component [Candidatus Nanohalobia archaeon BNXNv]